jgi:hypothetical protein
VFSALNVSAAAGAFEEDVGMLLSFDTLELEEFKAVGKKAMYKICVKVSRASSLEGVKIEEVGGCVWSRCLPKRLFGGLYTNCLLKRGQLTSNGG